MNNRGNVKEGAKLIILFTLLYEKSDQRLHLSINKETLNML